MPLVPPPKEAGVAKRNWHLYYVAVELRRQGVSYPVIATRVGLSLNTVWAWLTGSATTPEKKARHQSRYRTRMKRMEGCDDEFLRHVRTKVKHGIRTGKERGYIGCLTDPVVIFKAFNGKCAICETPISKQGHSRTSGCIDHCHETGMFRGWLCGRCNRLLPHGTSASVLFKAGAYLMDQYGKGS